MISSAPVLPVVPQTSAGAPPAAAPPAGEAAVGGAQLRRWWAARSGPSSAFSSGSSSTTPYNAFAGILQLNAAAPPSPLPSFRPVVAEQVVPQQPLQRSSAPAVLFPPTPPQQFRQVVSSMAIPEENPGPMAVPPLPSSKNTTVVPSTASPPPPAPFKKIPKKTMAAAFPLLGGPPLAGAPFLVVPPMPLSCGSCSQTPTFEPNRNVKIGSPPPPLSREVFCSPSAAGGGYQSPPRPLFSFLPKPTCRTITEEATLQQNQNQSSSPRPPPEVGEQAAGGKIVSRTRSQQELRRPRSKSTEVVPERKSSFGPHPPPPRPVSPGSSVSTLPDSNEDGPPVPLEVGQVPQVHVAVAGPQMFFAGPANQQYLQGVVPGRAVPQRARSAEMLPALHNRGSSDTYRGPAGPLQGPFQAGGVPAAAPGGQFAGAHNVLGRNSGGEQYAVWQQPAAQLNQQFQFKFFAEAPAEQVRQPPAIQQYERGPAPAASPPAPPRQQDNVAAVVGGFPAPVDVPKNFPHGSRSDRRKAKGELAKNPAYHNPEELNDDDILSRMERSPKFGTALFDKPWQARWRPLKRLGSGASGETWLIQSREDNSVAVIKRIPRNGDGAKFGYITWKDYEDNARLDLMVDARW